MKPTTKKILAAILAAFIIASSMLTMASCRKKSKGESSFVAPFIGENGNWWVGSTDTGVSALGKDGKDGAAGTDGKDGANGTDAITPQLRINATTKVWEISYDNGKTWVDTGVVAVGAVGTAGKDGKDGKDGADGQNGQDGQNGENGEDGITPEIRINVNGRWEVSYDEGASWTDLGVTAKGDKGEDGVDGISPLVKIENGNWHYSHDGGLTWTDTKVQAEGKNGTDGLNGIDGTDGANGKDGITPTLRINYDTGKWEVSYDNGKSWQDLGVVAKGEDGNDGVAPVVKIEDGYWKISRDNGRTWTNTGVKATGSDGKDGIDGIDGKDGVTPQIRINTTTNKWQVSYDNGNTWSDLGDATASVTTPKFRVSSTNKLEVSYDDGASWEVIGELSGGSDGTNGVTPKIGINKDTYMWEVSYDNGLTWQSLGVSAKGTDGQNGTNGTNGQNGANGNDGRGIAKMEIIDGCLYVTYTDSPTPINLGKISSGTEGGVVTPSEPNYTDGLAFYPVQDENGTGYTYGVAIGNAIYMRDIVIPTIYNGKAVTVILSGAFANADYSPNSTVSSVVIPEGITKIGDSAFYNCDNIAKITLPSTIEEIGIDAFAGLGASTEAGSATIYINLTQAECEARGLALEESGCTIVYLC